MQSIAVLFPDLHSVIGKTNNKKTYSKLFYIPAVVYHVAYFKTLLENVCNVT